MAKREDEFNYNGAMENKAAAFESSEFDPKTSQITFKPTSHKTNVISPESIDSLTPNEQTKFQRFKKILLSLLCGIEEDVDQHEVGSYGHAQAENQKRIAHFHSLKQTKFQKIILNVNLGIILCIAAGLYIFFSIPPQSHIFKHVTLNQTLTDI